YNKDCLVVPVKPKIFLADAECIISFAHQLNYNQSWINWESMYGSRFPSIATFDRRNISFHEDMSEKYDASRRRLAVIISNQPCVPFSIKSNISKMAFSLYTKRPLYYNKRYQIVHLNKNIEDIDFSNCSVPIFGSYRNVSVGPCLLSKDKNTLLCSYNQTEFLPEAMYESP
ncbi:GSCOCG00008408001-RA-CDS, partial [Cotesia congregata]